METHLDRDNSYYYILTKDAYNGEDLLMDILGFIPDISDALSFAAQLERVIEENAYEDIVEADGYAMITTMYNRVTQASSAVLSGWHDYPCMYVRVPNATNVVFTKFDYHDPWN